MEFDEVEVDEWIPASTGCLSKTALMLNEEHTMIVAKKTRPGLTTKEIAEQIMADSVSYSSSHTGTTLFYFVYDPEGRIGSPKRLETDLTSANNHNHYKIEVLVAPK